MVPKHQNTRIFQCPECNWQGTVQDMDDDDYEEFYGEDGVFSSGYTGSNYACPVCKFHFDCGCDNCPSEEFLIIECMTH